jgi:hypothetical protein
MACGHPCDKRTNQQAPLQRCSGGTAWPLRRAPTRLAIRPHRAPPPVPARLIELCAARCVLRVARCMLHVVCCALCVARCCDTVRCTLRIGASHACPARIAADAQMPGACDAVRRPSGPPHSHGHVVHAAACGLRPAACGLRHAACGMRPAACGMPVAPRASGQVGESALEQRQRTRKNLTATRVRSERRVAHPFPHRHRCDIRACTPAGGRRSVPPSPRAVALWQTQGITGAQHGTHAGRPLRASHTARGGAQGAGC